MNVAPDPAWLAAALALGALLSLGVRSGRWLARAFAVLAMLALALAVRVPPAPEVAVAPARLAVATTAPVDDAVAAALARARAAAGDGADAVAVAPPDPAAIPAASTALAAALARAVLRAGPRADEVLVLWNGPATAAARPSPHPAFPFPAPVGGAFVAVPPLPFEPDAVRIALQQTAQTDRPARLEVAIPGLEAGLAGTVTVRRGGAAVATEAILVPATGAAEVPFTAAEPGVHEIELALDVAGHRVVRRGTFVVAAPQRVLVLDPSGTAQAALAAQGIDIATGSDGLDRLEDFAALVLGQALPVPLQGRVAEAVDAGLGLCAFGPGLQQDGEPLRELLPIRVLPPAGGDGDGDGGPGPDPRSPPDQPPPDQPPPDRPPPPDPARPDPPPRDPPPDRPPTGATGDAKPLPGDPIEVDKRSVAMVLVVDRSGTMGNPLPNGATKMSYAKSSARATAAALDEGDEVGIVTFGNSGMGRVELPLTAATDRDTVARGVAALAHAPEATYLLSGLRQALAMLQRSTAAVRHVVVVTDGEFYDDETVVRSLANEMRQKHKITLSIIAIIDSGTAADFKRMSQFIARDGGGEFLPVQDPSHVPQLVSAEVTRSLGKVGRTPRDDAPERPAPDRPEQPPEQPPEKPPEPAPKPPEQPEPTPGKPRLPVRAVVESPLLSPRPEPDWPAVGGVVRAAAKLEAHVLLVAGDEGLPLLGFANRGLGRVGAIAIDLGGEDAAELRAEAAFPARLAQWVSALLRPSPSPQQVLEHDGTIAPPAPTPADVAALAELAGAEPKPLADLAVPPPRRTVVHGSLVPDAALWTVLALVLLGLVEWWTARWRP